MPKRIGLNYICDFKKLKQIKKGLKAFRLNKIDQMIEDKIFLNEKYYRENTSEGAEDILDKTRVFKEENILISGNQK